MQLRIYWILATTVVILAGCNGATEKEQNTKERTTTTTTTATRRASPYLDDADLYLDDQEDFEGSGRGGGELRDDLEASGSGLGPDDEDGAGGVQGGDITNRIDTIRPPVEPKILPPIEENTNTKTKTTSIQTDKQPDPEIDVIQTGEDDSDRLEEENIHEVYIMNPKHEDRASSFFAQPGVLAAVIGGAVVGLLCAILVVMFIVYRMRKKDEGSYALDEPRRSPAASAFPKPGAPHHNREFYA